jgi:hypothetical protein
VDKSWAFRVPDGERSTCSPSCDGYRCRLMKPPTPAYKYVCYLRYMPGIREICSNIVKCDGSGS